ncbi:MAG: LPS export ABC transporter ATP-binding protein [Nitrospirae bacterium]|jgi:lipopolysaccharide export system ATP-binding protein|uniref:ABC transporter, ATP-binding protein n=1 Tax=Leptospirillum ferrodiazotrophum TaxID=412449 RepID=C6HU24_9BACT|nr:MAG: ABC transporter, ATP-binding protein [Leptospirillum ferrodiazotrophum]MCL5952959.1 LPS export ABC transporter ATP-binding protein [Nitrospirota bacterium]
MAIEAVGLMKTYHKRRVVNGVNLLVNPGEVVGLLGPNGAGKTTSFYMIVGLVKPDGGRILMGGEDISKMPMHKRARLGISYLPQESSIFRKLSVADNIMAVLEFMDLTPAERQNRLDTLLSELNVGHLRTSKAYTLSGGERRRVEVARALATKPEYILLDEPFAGIDPIAVIEIQKIIAQLKSRGIGVLITDHNVRETLEITDRAYVINQGQILEEGTPRQIASSPKVREFYLGERFLLNQDMVQGAS